MVANHAEQPRSSTLINAHQRRPGRSRTSPTASTARLSGMSTAAPAFTSRSASSALTPYPAIACERLGHRFGRLVALDQVHFTVPQGQVVGLLGPNGAGKTTLLRCLTGAMRPTFGRVLINGHDPHEQHRLAQTMFGYQPDGASLEPELRVQEFLQLSASLRGLRGKRRTQRVATCIDTVDLGDKARALIGTLSRGQLARVALAEALLHQPPVLILDEPASGLDPAQVVALRQLTAPFSWRS